MNYAVVIIGFALMTFGVSNTTHLRNASITPMGHVKIIKPSELIVSVKPRSVQFRNKTK